MKSTKLIVGLLLLNLTVVAGLLAYLVATQPNTNSAGIPGRLSDAAKAARGSTEESPGNVIVVTNEIRWTQLESEDYHEYIARLRSIGCPEQTIRDIIIADLDKVMAPEIQALYGRREELKYWHSTEEELANDVDSREVSRKRSELEKRKRQIIRELVGADLLRERLEQQGEDDFYERRLSFLPEDRRTQVRELLERYDEAQQRFRERELEDGDPLNAADRAQLRTLRQQLDANLGELLTQEEKAQYELWMSASANQVRHAFYGMNATEQEFLAAYQARKDFDEKWGGVEEAFPDPLSQAQREADRQMMEQRIRESLGEERFAQYKRGEDEDYHMLSALTTRFKLGKEKAAEVYSYKKVATDIKAQLRNDPTLTEEQKDAALKAIVDETVEAVKASLGDRAYRYYTRTGQGAWIRE